MFKRDDLTPHVLYGALCASILFAGGCASNRVDLKEMYQLRVEATSTKSVIVDPPNVWQEDGHTIVYGHVKRASGAYMVGAGHTHVQVLLPETGIVTEQWVTWSPKWVPFRGPRYSTYRVTYPWVTPRGSSVQVWVCFDEHHAMPGGKAPTTAQSL